MNIQHNYDLSAHNTFGVSAQASQFAEYSSIEELRELIKYIRDETLRVFHIGGGSNVVFVSDFDGIVLHSRIKGITLIREDAATADIRIGAAEVWDEALEHFVRSGWYGAECLSLIPGEVGAAAVQNIGAYGSEIEQHVVSVEAVDLRDGTMLTIGHDQCRYGYRKSIFKEEMRDRVAITHVTLRLRKDFVPNLSYGALANEVEKRGIAEPTAQEIRQIVIDIRKSKLPDPTQIGNAGSFFMNPIVSRSKFDEICRSYPAAPHYDMGDCVKIPAGWLIEMCGWKGRSLGRVGVYEKQALILVNNGGCTGSEVSELSKQIVSDVQQKFGIDIHPEVILI